MGCLSAACLLLSFLTHVQRSAPVPLLSSLFFKIQHVGACGVAAAAVFTGETLPQKCPFRTSEGRIVPCRVGVRVKRRERLEGLYWCSLSSSPSSSSPSFFLSTATKHTLKHTRTLAKKKRKKKKSTLAEGPLPLAAFRRAQLAALSGALRGRAWRLESAEIEAEEGDEKVEEDVCDEGRKKIERLKEWIPC